MAKLGGEGGERLGEDDAQGAVVAGRPDGREEMGCRTGGHERKSAHQKRDVASRAFAPGEGPPWPKVRFGRGTGAAASGGCWDVPGLAVPGDWLEGGLGRPSSGTLLLLLLLLLRPADASQLRGDAVQAGADALTYSL